MHHFFIQKRKQLFRINFDVVSNPISICIENEAIENYELISVIFLTIVVSKSPKHENYDKYFLK